MMAWGSAVTGIPLPSASASLLISCGANLPLIYIIEDNGVYGLTKGQFSATADLGSTPETGSSTTCRPSTPA